MPPLSKVLVQGQKLSQIVEIHGAEAVENFDRLAVSTVKACMYMSKARREIASGWLPTVAEPDRTGK